MEAAVARDYGQYEDGPLIIYIHKERELEDVKRFYPANHYVLIDDKLRILTAVKKIWGERVTTVFPKQGYYALIRVLWPSIRQRISSLLALLT